MQDFLKKIFTRDNLFLFLVLFAGLAVSTSAAVFSVTGLALTFAGKSKQIAIVMATLEGTKLVIITTLKLYWSEFSWYLKILTITFSVVLMVITSAGVYGFFSGAYQETADQLTIDNKQIAIVESKKERFETQLTDYQGEKETVVANITMYTEALKGNVIEYIDPETGQKVTTTSSATRRVVQDNLEDARARRDLLSTRIDNLNDTLVSLDIQILDLQSNSEASSELGILRYISEVSGWSLDKCANMMIILIVIVVDPLAVLCLLLFTSLLIKAKNKNLFKMMAGSTYVNPRPFTPLQPTNPTSSEKNQENNEEETGENSEPVEEPQISEAEDSPIEEEPVSSFEEPIDNIEEELPEPIVEDLTEETDPNLTNLYENLSEDLRVNSSVEDFSLNASEFETDLDSFNLIPEEPETEVPSIEETPINTVENEPIDTVEEEPEVSLIEEEPEDVVDLDEEEKKNQ
jgi:hypothetical protein